MNLDKLHTLDRIVLDESGYRKMAQWYEENKDKQESLDIPFYEGIICLNLQDITDEDIEKYNKNDKFGRQVSSDMESELLGLIDRKQMHTYFSLGNDGIFKGMQLEYDKQTKSYDLMVSFECDLKTTEDRLRFKTKSHFKNLKLKDEELQTHAFKALELTMKTLHYVSNYKGDVTVSEHRVTRTKKGKSKGGKPGKRRVVNVTVKTYSFGNDSKETTTRREYERKTEESWRVRGHWRYYKETGKRVWIQPYTKGNGAVQPKDYKI